MSIGAGDPGDPTSALSASHRPAPPTKRHGRGAWPRRLVTALVLALAAGWAPTGLTDWAEQRLAAAPGLGTGSAQIGYVATDRRTVANLCTALAGHRTEAFETQIASVIHGEADRIVALDYSRVNARALAGLYDAKRSSTLDNGELPGRGTAGRGWLFSDAVGPRVSLIHNTGLGHA